MLRSLPYGEADQVVTVFTQQLGVVSVLSRGARQFRRGAPSALEPMHTLQLELTERAGAELLGMRSASIAAPRLHLTRDLDRMQAAGRALRWLRRSLPPRTPEPEAWSEIHWLLYELDRPLLPRASGLLLADFGVTLTAALGYALNLRSCVVCGRQADPGKSAFLDSSLGGIVCRSCGGRGLLLPADTRARLIALYGGERGALVEQDVAVAIELIESTLRAHMGIEPEDPATSGSRA